MEYATRKLVRPLQANQYYPTKVVKKRIILHHTAGGSAQSSVDWWNTNPDHVATAFIIDRDGHVYQNFDPQYWSYALGLTGGTNIEKSSIQIELASWGPVQWKEGDNEFTAIASPKTTIPFNNVVACPFRGYKFYERYTDEQVESCVGLIAMLVHDFKIELQEHLEGFWNLAPKPLSVGNGLYAHTTFRKDKADIYPQPSLIQAIYNKFVKL